MLSSSKSDYIRPRIGGGYNQREEKREREITTSGQLICRTWYRLGSFFHRGCFFGDEFGIGANAMIG